MAASFEAHSGSEIEFDESDESEIEYFDPYGQMNDEVREILLRLAREERAEKIAAEQSFNFDQASNTEEPALKEQEFYGHYSFWMVCMPQRFDWFKFQLSIIDRFYFETQNLIHKNRKKQFSAPKKIKSCDIITL